MKIKMEEWNEGYLFSTQNTEQPMYVLVLLSSLKSPFHVI